MNKKQYTKTKKKINRGILSGIANIHCSFNNTIITITDIKGNVLGWSNGGTVGFKGSRKATPFASSKASNSLAQEALQMGLKNLDIRVKGFGPGRDPAIRGLYNAGLKINSLSDVTPLPHNGVRPPKKRRI
jgi:small subunit ribosomal protein S11